MRRIQILPPKSAALEAVAHAADRIAQGAARMLFAAVLVLAGCKKESSDREVTENGFTAHVSGPGKVIDGTFLMPVQNTSTTGFALRGSCAVQYVAPGETVSCQEPAAGFPAPSLSAPNGDFAPMRVSDVTLTPVDAHHVRVDAVWGNDSTEAREVDAHLSVLTRTGAVVGGKEEFAALFRLLYPGEETVARYTIAVSSVEDLHANVLAYGRKTTLPRETRATIADYHVLEGGQVYLGTLTNVSAKPLYPWVALAFHDGTGRILGGAPCDLPDQKPIAPGASVACTTPRGPTMPNAWETVEVRRAPYAADIVMPREQLYMP